MEKRPVSVVIVGSGLAGLAALKEFSGAGFDVTVFEKRDQIAGIWAYSDDPTVRSVAKTTLSNTSKYMVNHPPIPLIAVLLFRFSNARGYSFLVLF
jgi:dimethylaniline monooxygenase (N-oxide forming)